MFSLVLLESLLHFIVNHTDFPVNKTAKKYSAVFLNNETALYFFYIIFISLSDRFRRPFYSF